MFSSKTMPKYLLSSLTVLLVSVAASAQNHPGASPTPSAASSGDAQSYSTDPNDPQRTWDKAFVKKMSESDQAAMELSALALQNSQSEDVKHFSQTMLDERKQFESALDPIAKQFGMTRPTSSSNKDKKEIAKLKALSGPKFDQEYMSLLTKESQQSLKDSNTEAANTPNAALKDVAQKNVKAITDRLQQIQSLSKQ